MNSAMDLQQYPNFITKDRGRHQPICDQLSLQESYLHLVNLEQESKGKNPPGESRLRFGPLCLPLCHNKEYVPWFLLTINNLYYQCIYPPIAFMGNNKKINSGQESRMLAVKRKTPLAFSNRWNCSFDPWRVDTVPKSPCNVPTIHYRCTRAVM